MAITKRPSALPKNSSEQKPWEDEVLRQLYAERDKYAAELGFDLDRIFADLKVTGAIEPSNAAATIMVVGA